MRNISKILGIIIVITLLISCGGGGGGGGGSGTTDTSSATTSTTAAPSLTGCWWTRTYQDNSGNTVTEDWNFDNSTWTMKAFDGSGTLKGTQSIPYTLSGNSISYIRPDKGWNCSLEYTLTTTTLTITKSIENGRDVTSSRFPYVFTRK